MGDRVPDLSRVESEDAMRALAADVGLRLVVVDVTVETRPFGRFERSILVRQSPDPGTVVPTGSPRSSASAYS